MNNLFCMFCFLLPLSSILGDGSSIHFPDESSFEESHEAGAGQGLGKSQHPRAGGGDIFFPREPVTIDVPCTTYKGEGGACRLVVQCATFFAEIAELSRSPCAISQEQPGVCCPHTQESNFATRNVIPKQPSPNVAVPPLQVHELNHACEKSLKKQEEREEFERELVRNNIVAPPGSPVFFHARLFETTNEIVQKSKAANLALSAAKELQNDFQMTKEQGQFGLPRFGVQNTIISNTCPPEPICPETKYRTMDGSCNNLGHKNWGKAGAAFQRILPPDYEDGLSLIRKSSNGAELPSARLLSSFVTLDHNSEYDNFTLLIMQWGQFLDHDLTHTPITKGSNMADISCCHDGHRRPRQVMHPECMPIDIPDNDNFYGRFNQKCMEFVRSMPAIREHCSFGAREQMNQITGFIDASNVYGSSEEETRALRAFAGGELRVKVHEGRSLLPGDQNALGCFSHDQRECFKAGDNRVNEQPDLAVLHTIWMRQHNRLAAQLAQLNPGWTDQIIFQEARRIVAAQMQHITYNEYLPIILGRQYMETYDLVPLKRGFYNKYQPNIDPTITNAFASAAFRYGHTLITRTLQGYGKFGNLENDLRLSETQFSPFMLYNRGTFDSLLRGLLLQPSQRFDRFFTEELTNRLFAQTRPFGMDLVALNIQRGRDHGLPPYPKWREICGLSPVRSWQDLAAVMDFAVISNLQRIYSSVQDVDLFVGGIAETPVAGSLLGPTFLCIVGDQFARLKLGDRFYYENGGFQSSFGETQLDEIRKTSLARILCDNSDNVELIQPLAFVQAHLVNAVMQECNIGALPVFVFPASLDFYVDDRATHKNVLTLYNPYDIPVSYQVLCNVPKKYVVAEPQGILKPRHYTDIVVRHVEPVLANANAPDKFRIQIYEEGRKQVRGTKDICSTLHRTSTEAAQLTEREDFQSLEPKPRTPALHNVAHNTYGTPISPGQGPSMWLMGSAVICLLALFLPTQGDQSLSAFPAYVHLSANVKIVIAYILGLLTFSIFRPL